MNLSTTFASLRKQVAGISLVTLVAGLFATGIATAATTHVFTDVPADAWYEPYVIGLSNEGVIDSTQDMYRPGDLVNRAEMAKLTLFVSGLPMESASAAPYKDVPMGQWYTDYIYTLTKNGIVSGDKKDGVPTGYFRPSDSLNRAEATKMLVNAAQMAEDLTGAPHFPDVNVSTDWFGNFVETAFNNGVVSGYPDGTFRPANNINRAEVAKMVYLSMNPAVAGFSLSSAAASSKTGVQLIFSQNVDQATAEMVANYKIVDSSGSSLAVTSATMSSPDTVDLVTASQTAGKTYEVTAMNVKSDAGDDMTNTDSVSFLGYGSDVSGGDLKVSLSTETPVAGSIPQGATGVVFTCWDFLASSSTPVTVKSLNVRRVGPGSETAFVNVYLYRGDQRVTTGRSINNSSQMVQFSNINQVVNSGDNAKMCLVGDLSTSSSGGVHAFELTTSGDVLSNSSAMTGSFPLRGADQLITTADVGTSTIKKNGSLDEVTLGSTGARVAQFEIDADSAEDQQLRRLAIYVRGSVPTTALQNFKLYAEGNASPLATAASVGPNDLVTLVLASPFKIGKGENKIFYLTADVVGARTGDDVKIYFDETTDVFITGVTFGYGTRVIINAYDGDDPNATPGDFDDQYSYVLLKGSKFTIAFNGPAAGDIAVNQKDAHCMDLSITNAAGLDVTIKDWVVNLTTTGGDALVGASGKNFTSIELAEVNDDGTIAGNLLGSSELLGGAGTSTEDVTLKGTYTIASGETKKAAIIFDVANNPLIDGGTVKCSLLAPTGNDQVKDSNNDPLGAANITPSSTIGGNTMNLVASSLAFTKNSSPANFTKYAKGTNNATLLAFQAKAGSSLDTTIKSLTVTADNSITTAADLSATTNAAGNITMSALPSGAGYVTGIPLTPVYTCTTNPVTTVTTVDTTGALTSINQTLTTAGTGCSAVTLVGPTVVDDIKNIVDSIGIYDGSGTLVSELKSFPASTAGSNMATLTFNNLNIPVAKNATVNLFLKGMVSNSLSGAAIGEFYLSGTPLVIDGSGQTVTGVDITAVDASNTNEESIIVLGSSPAVSPTVTASNDPKIFAENDTHPVFGFTLKSTDGASTLQDMTVNLTSTGALLPVDSVALYSATSSGACDTGTTALKGYESVVASTPTTGSVKFTNIGKTLPDSQNVYLCVSLKSKTISSGQPLSKTDIGLVNIVFDKVQDQSGTNLVVPSITPSISSSFFFKGVPTFTPVTNDTVLTSSTDIFKFTAGSIGSVSSLNQLAITFEGVAPAAAGCDLYRGPDASTIGTLLTAAPVAPAGQVVTFGTGNFVGGVATPWVNGNVYTVKCTYTGLLSGNSSKAKLASLTAANSDAVIWDDSNGAPVTDLTDATGFGLVDDILFFNVIQGTKASTNF